MAIIHCGFVPHQNKGINQAAGFRRNNPADDSTTKSYTRLLGKMPSTAQPVPQAAQPSELFFPNGHAVRLLIRYIYSAFN